MKLSNLLFYKSQMPTSYLPKRKACGPMFEDPAINRLIDAHRESVEQNGYEKLVIPKSLHKIDSGILPPHDRYVADTLYKNGFHSYLCGGSVRDLVLNDTVNDFDFVTDASNEDLRNIFDNIQFHKIPSGHEFGYIDFGDEIVDICTMVNIPADYYGKIHVPDFEPDELYSSNLLFDAFQRDLKINTLYYDTTTEEMIDWFGGLYDLREGVISTPAAPYDALHCDPRIVLRALRFKARFGFDLSKELEETVRKYGQELAKEISPGAKKSNLPGFFSAGYTYTGACILLEYGLFGTFFPLLGSKVDAPEYQEYAKRAAFAIDWIYDEGAVGLPLLAMAAFLWPVVKNLKRKGVQNAEDQVLKSQRETIRLTEDETAFLLESLHIEEVYDEQIINKAIEEVFEKPTLEDALNVLRIHYWKHPFEY